MNVAIYCRVSTEDQKERETIVTQRDFATRYCEMRDHTVYDIYEDDGISATKFPSLLQRPAGSRLLEDARAGKFEVVLVYKLDRLGRGAMKVLTAVAELEEYVSVQSMTEAFDSTTASGRLLRTIMAGAGEYERDTFIERSAEATNRLARDGQWMGGIVPYGYRVVGLKRDARLQVSEETIEGMTMSEADVIRLIYRMSVEGHSCAIIADHLNALGIPPSYSRDGREVTRGKRKETTQGIWRYGRICNMIKNTTYKGVHSYGQRSAKKREIIERTVAAIVSESTWGKAQETLKKNFLFNARSAKRKYLLRGLMKCAICGLTYIGTGRTTMLKQGNKKLGLPPGEFTRTYYCCNGKHNGRSLYGDAHRSCASKNVSGDIEDVVITDIVAFLRNPGDVLSELQKVLAQNKKQPEDLQSKLDEAHSLLSEKGREKDRVLALFRRGRIDEITLDRQLDEIAAEEEGVRKQSESLMQDISATQEGIARFETLEPLLSQIKRRLEEPLSWETKRKLVETLIESIEVETIEEKQESYAKVLVTYCFGSPEHTEYEPIRSTDNYTDVRAVSCWAERRPARRRKSPAPAPRRKSAATCRASVGRCSTASTFTSKCRDFRARN